MTKPESSKKESTEETGTKSEPPDDPQTNPSPTTAKDLFADFAPDESDSSDDDSGKKSENYEPASKKPKDSSKVRLVTLKNHTHRRFSEIHPQIQKRMGEQTRTEILVVREHPRKHLLLLQVL